jgi:hypothetical protein
MDLGYTNVHVLITGASGGIGSIITKLFLGRWFDRNSKLSIGFMSCSYCKSTEPELRHNTIQKSASSNRLTGWMSWKLMLPIRNLLNSYSLLLGRNSNRKFKSLLVRWAVPVTYRSYTRYKFHYSVPWNLGKGRGRFGWHGAFTMDPDHLCKPIW